MMGLTSRTDEHKGVTSSEEIDVDDGGEHEEGDDDEGDLEPLLELASEDDGIEAALLEA